MRVILRENIENLGKKGDIVRVASGYGRNHLLPKKLAIEVTPSNMKMIEIQQQALKKGLEKEMVAYRDVVQKINLVELSFIRKTGEKDVVFGSVSSSDIKEALDKLGFDIDKKKILLDEPIKRLGNYSVPIKIFQEEKAEIKIEVIKEKAAKNKGEKAVKKPGPEKKEEEKADKEKKEEPQSETKVETTSEGKKEEVSSVKEAD
ncbi:MAG: 50S ribosomal protein L9 [Acidobacteriota bacterium]|nr:50S ribosomal protein L9 [Acidobacteriota bacterium]